MAHPRKPVARVTLKGTMTLDHDERQLSVEVRVILYQEMVDGSPGLYDQDSEVSLAPGETWDLIMSSTEHPVRFGLQFEDGSELKGRFKDQVLWPAERRPIRLALTQEWVAAHLPR